MLLKGVNGKERFLSLSTGPVRHQLLPVEFEPLSHEPTCPARETANQHPSVVDLDPGLVLAYTAWKCAGWWSCQYM